MSQHIFQKNSGAQTVRVVLGYDRPLNYFFLTVQRLNSSSAPSPFGAPSDDDDGFLYSNLSDPDAGFRADLQYYRDRLKQLAITIPERMFDEVTADAANRVGNRVVRYLANGEMKELLGG